MHTPSLKPVQNRVVLSKSDYLYNAKCNEAKDMPFLAERKSARRRYRSMDSRTFLVNASNVNGFCKKWLSGVIIPFFRIKASVYPEK